MSYRLIRTSEASAWLAELPVSRSVFGSLGFARVQERDGDTEAILVVAEAAEERALYPLLLRRTPFDPSARDSVTAPFTGPLAGLGASTSALKTAIDEAMAELGVVAEFAHLNPWHARPALLDGVGVDRDVIWVDTTIGEDTLWRESLSHSCRKNIRRAEREGVVVRPAADRDDIERFHRIYAMTMERNDALPAYRFDADYFHALFAEFPDNARFALAEHDGEVVAATLYVHDDETVYSYLGGANHSAQAVRPTNAVVHETIRWARDQGKRRLVLGGGYRPGDGIERFKASFSPLRAELRLARSVRNRPAYDTLCDAWERMYAQPPPGDGFFPAYRAPAP